MPIRVLVVDDSVFMRKLISDALEEDRSIKVVGAASTGEQGLQKIKELKPDVVTLDYQMPGWNGLQTLQKIMEECPTPVVMVSGHTKEGAALTIECLEEGAVDFVLKPSGSLSMDIDAIASQLREKVRLAAEVSRQKLLHKLKKPKRLSKKSLKGILSGRVIVMGASTGGPRTVEYILRQLPPDTPCSIIVVIHMPPHFTKSFAERLARTCVLPVKEAGHREKLEEGTIYVAPGDFHLKVECSAVKGAPKGVIHLTQSEKVSGYRPSIDVAMQSVSQCYGENAVGVILTGMGEDGVQGMADIQEQGGKTIAQDEASSIIFGMPKRTIEKIRPDKVIGMEQIAEEMLRMLR